MEMHIPPALFNGKHPPKIIDLHTHMFNARYLPLKGIFKGFGFRGLTPSVLAHVSWWLTDISKFPNLKRTDPQHLDSLHFANMKDHQLETLCGMDSYVRCLANDCTQLVNHVLDEQALQFDTLDLEACMDACEAAASKSFPEYTKAIIGLTLATFDEPHTYLVSEQTGGAKFVLDVKTFAFGDMFRNFFLSHIL